jgi:hypothetical protein
VTLVVNVYERTWRQALQPGRFRGIGEQNLAEFAERFVLINNVMDRDAVVAAAGALVEAGELTGYRFVADAIDEALRVARLPRRVLKRRGYFLDFGLAMTVTGTQPFILGWDPETELVEPTAWVEPAIQLLEADSSVGSASPIWPARETLADEAVREDSTWIYNWGFSDQVFLVRRADVAAPIYRAFAPASLARHEAHPFTFEARLESWQRASGRTRATHRVAEYQTNELVDVMVREGGYSASETRLRRVFILFRKVLTKYPMRHPRFRLP